ncbi:hypothetical protein B7R54_05385 [Subtercola boreus]|uniref:M23ase beta-sheet core domain-containing protein n=1 Tax=Subtercola boreus TaxID=120213 RepID=A0A3E0VFN5_9MICO|nr:M23 family metallopeptidase [Subtercola boreus]RFA08722.1 hypothetical protein B7R54_05385 [Subtercola boreus]TQL54324.1 peptidase M23-like protein [Subtercola boreus]
MYAITSTRAVAVGLLVLGMLGMTGVPGVSGVPGFLEPLPGQVSSLGPALPRASGSAIGRGRGVWPTDAPHPVVRPFEAPATRYSAGHRGIDIAAIPGQPVYAVLAGTVTFSGLVVDRPLVSVSHGDGVLSTVEPVTPTVRAGETVAAGQQIGVVAGSSSHCEPVCLHLGLRLNGEYVSPLLVLGGIPRAVLLPLDGDGGGGDTG